jgi:hypothetical protein
VPRSKNMSIWTFSRAVLLVTCTLMTGCTQIKNAEFLSSATPKPSNALAVVEMADGVVALTPPPNYCIDKGSLKARFALMARCDTLGAETNPNAPLAIITATLAPLGDRSNVPNAADLAAALEPNTNLQTSDKNGLALVQTQGATGLDGISERHWRGLFVVNGILVGLALYAPEGGPATGDYGASILTALAKRTKAETEARTVASSAAVVQPEPASLSNTN